MIVKFWINMEIWKTLRKMVILVSFNECYFSVDDQTGPFSSKKYKWLSGKAPAQLELHPKTDPASLGQSHHAVDFCAQVGVTGLHHQNERENFKQVNSCGQFMVVMNAPLPLK